MCALLVTVQPFIIAVSSIRGNKSHFGRHIDIYEAVRVGILFEYLKYIVKYCVDIVRCTQNKVLCVKR
jgi:hypothetical protein